MALAAWALLREARTLAGLAQCALAAHAGAAQAEIVQIENGGQEPSFDRLQRLVRAARLELRIELVPHRDRDDRRISLILEASPEERLDSLEAQDES